MGLAARRPGARDVRHRAAGDPQFRLVRPQCREAPIIYRPPVDPLARDFVYFFAIARRCSEVSWPGCSISTTSWAAQALRLLMSGLAVIVATGDLLHLRRQRVLRTVWAAALAAPALAVIATTFFVPWTALPKCRPRCRRKQLPHSSATISNGEPISGCVRSPAIRNWRVSSR
jgi:hypothetical protein